MSCFTSEISNLLHSRGKAEEIACAPYTVIHGGTGFLPAPPRPEGSTGLSSQYSTSAFSPTSQLTLTTVSRRVKEVGGTAGAPRRPGTLFVKAEKLEGWKVR